MASGLYFRPDYARLYQGTDGEVFTFSHRVADAEFYLTGIKRPIPEVAGQAAAPGLYDMETPYGLSGIYCTGNDAFFEEAVSLFKAQCRQEGIIAHFLRFNPYLQWTDRQKAQFNFFAREREAVSVPLDAACEEIRAGYADSLKRNIKKSERLGLQSRALPLDDDCIDHFERLYTATMQKNSATDFYFFDRAYFQGLAKMPGSLMYATFHEGRIINMIWLFDDGGKLYYHLGATDPEAYSLNPNPFVFDAIIKAYTGKRDALFMGGGTTNDPEDSLLKFKQKFSTNTIPFYIGGIVADQASYDQLNSLWEDAHETNISRFLKYRA